MRLDAFDAAAAERAPEGDERRGHGAGRAGRARSGDLRAPLAFMRYVGQGHEITVELPQRALQASDAKSLRDAYERDYAALFNATSPMPPSRS